MQKESLYRIRKGLIEMISHMDSLPLEDRIELMINLCHFLDDKKYERNIKILKLNK